MLQPSIISILKFFNFFNIFLKTFTSKKLRAIMDQTNEKEMYILHSNRYSLTEGSIWKAMLLFALPVFLGNVFQQLYNTFDAWCVGNYIGDEALAAVSSSGSLIFMMDSFFHGVAMGPGVVIARTLGA